MSFKSFSSTLPAGNKTPAADTTKIAPIHDQPAAPVDAAKPAPIPANKA